MSRTVSVRHKVPADMRHFAASRRLRYLDAQRSRGRVWGVDDTAAHHGGARREGAA
jgi:hypothetical protein